MKLIFAERAWEDYLYWQSIDKKIIKRINLIIFCLLPFAFCLAKTHFKCVLA